MTVVRYQPPAFLRPLSKKLSHMYRLLIVLKGAQECLITHDKTFSHVDVASATRAGGRVGDEPASLVVRVHF